MQNSLPMPVSCLGRICEAVLAQLELNRTSAHRASWHTTVQPCCACHFSLTTAAAVPGIAFPNHAGDHQYPIIRNELFWSGNMVGYRHTVSALPLMAAHTYKYSCWKWITLCQQTHTIVGNTRDGRSQLLHCSGHLSAQQHQLNVHPVSDQTHEFQ